MIKKEIDHPLRKIILEYDELKQQTAFEKKLVAEYILLHTIVEETKKECDRLLYFYKEHDAEVTIVEKKFHPFLRL